MTNPPVFTDREVTRSAIAVPGGGALSCAPPERRPPFTPPAELAAPLRVRTRDDPLVDLGASFSFSSNFSDHSRDVAL